MYAGLYRSGYKTFGADQHRCRIPDNMATSIARSAPSIGAGSLDPCEETGDQTGLAYYRQPVLGGAT